MLCESICIYSSLAALCNHCYYILQMDVGEGARKRVLDEMSSSSVTSDIPDDKVNQ